MGKLDSLRKGFKGFTLLTIGQIVSLTGSAMTQFGLGIWIWKTTGNATPFSIISFAFVLPNILFSTVAGALVDRLPRKISLILPDLSAGIVTVITLLLLVSNRLSLPFLYVAAFISGAFNTFQWPAYSVALSSMLKKEDYAKANGLFSLTDNAPILFAPILAGALIGFIGLEGIMLIDIITFIFAILMVIIVEIPQVESEVKEKFNIIKESIFGFKYIYGRKELLSLLTVFMLANFLGGFASPLFSPMILGRFNNNSVILGTIQTFFGVGGILGGLLMSIWGGFKKKIYALLFSFLIAEIGAVLFGFSSSFYLLCALALIMEAMFVIVNASSQSIWQSIVPIQLQGRVFSARRFIAQFATTISMLASGPLVDRLLVKFFEETNMLTKIFGYGKSASIGFLVSFTALLSIVVLISAFNNPLVMNVESLANKEETLKEVAS